MAKLTLFAYVPSASEYDKYFDKFRAFMSADVSEKAKDNGAFASDNYYNKGWYFLRSAVAGYSHGVWVGYNYVKRLWNYSSIHSAGLRVAFNLIYNPKCNLVKGCRIMERTTKVWDYEKYEDIEVTSKAPIVEYGGNKCIWLNKEECERGEASTMELWTLDLIDKAVPFDIKGNHNDFAKATELIEQCYSALTENCTKEELDMLVPVEMSSKDGYERAVPIEQEQENE